MQSNIEKSYPDHLCEWIIDMPLNKPNWLFLVKIAKFNSLPFILMTNINIFLLHFVLLNELKAVMWFFLNPLLSSGAGVKCIPLIRHAGWKLLACQDFKNILQIMNNTVVVSLKTDIPYYFAKDFFLMCES